MVLMSAQFTTTTCHLLKSKLVTLLAYIAANSQISIQFDISDDHRTGEVLLVLTFSFS